MTNAVIRFGQQCQFSPEAIRALTAAALVLEVHDGAMSAFSVCRENFFAENGQPWEQLNSLAEQTGLHRFTVHQLFLIYCAGQTHDLYRKVGYSDDFYWDGMKDLKYKMEETHTVYGVWGVYCGPWLSSFILMKFFCLGRLQYEIIKSEFHYERAGHTLKPHDTVLNVHIPSFGRLTYEDVLDSYTRAAKFFSHLFPDGAVWFHCETWIFYPPVNALLPNGNMKRFSEDYELVHSYIDPETDDRYRVFMVPADVPMEHYPENNALQRNLKKWLLDGNTMGLGHGLFLWKDGHIVPHI